jgi:Holliday junction DNA helicase RuvB
LLGVKIGVGGAEAIAARCRGTPRVANNLLRFTRDYALERAKGIADAATVSAALELLEIDRHGLDEMDHRVLRAIAEFGNSHAFFTTGVVVGAQVLSLENQAGCQQRHS